MTEAIINYVIAQLHVIQDALPSFLIAVVGASAIVWYVLTWRYDGIIANRDSEISSLRTERDAYKTKSGGASPDEVKAKLGDLAEMSRYTVGAKWQPLNSDEITELAKQFAKIPPKRIQVMYSNYRGKDLAQTFVDALRQAGWTDILFSEGGGLGAGVSTGRGNGAAIALKDAAERATKLKIVSIGPTEPDISVCFIAVGINTE